MSGVSTTSQTPCPAPAALDPSHRRISSFELFGDETTTNIDYTRAIDQPLTGIKPRRRSMLMGPARKKTAAPVTIFEDVSEEQEMACERQDQKLVESSISTTSRSTLLGKPPAKRAPGMVRSGFETGAGVGGHSMNYSRTGSTGVAAGYGSRSAATRPQTMAGQIHGGLVVRPYQSSMMSTTGSQTRQNNLIDAAGIPSTRPGNGLKDVCSTVRKPPRRQTIFVPEDTTVMSIHPGPRDNTSRIEDSFHLPSLAVHHNPPSQVQSNEGISSRPTRSILRAPAVKISQRRQSILVPDDNIQRYARPQPEHRNDSIDETCDLSNFDMQRSKQYPSIRDAVKQRPLRKPRQSILAPPKRLPLRESPSAENMPGWDVAGANTGKENIPPAGQDTIEKGFKCLSARDHSSTQSCRQSLQPSIRSSLYAPTQASQHRQSAVSSDQRRLIAGRPKPARPSVSFQEPVQEPYDWRPAVLRREAEVQKVRAFVASKRNEQQTARLRQYPILEGELSEPALYEDKWLSHREAALTEVINGIFETTSPTAKSHASSVGMALTEQLINLYHRPETTLVHDRLKASLQYGALATPQSSIGNHQPSKDRRLQQQLLDLWFESYSPSLLVAAAQVVSGRQVHNISVDSQSKNSSSREFVRDFFVTVIDSDCVTHSTDNDTDADTIRWQKIMLRSLMLIWLLDKSAEARIVDGECLLKVSSIRKSSAAILQTLGALMLPACGDIIRALKHLTYEITYRQDPLDEIVYHIENIAMDFRDGILLTRLIEALLYKSETENDDHPTSTAIDDLTLDCETPLPKDSIAPKTLSRSLKIPASTPAHRLFNMQIALNAVESSSGSVDTKPEHILYGHREKTLDFLWTLITSYGGLSYLVNWNLLVADTATSAVSNWEVLLQQWASVRSGMEVKNLSTSFTSAKVYIAILRGYGASPGLDVVRLRDDEVLEELLRDFGCFSEGFVQSLVRSVGVVVCEETVMCHLAVLAGSLLDLSGTDVA